MKNEKDYAKKQNETDLSGSLKLYNWMIAGDTKDDILKAAAMGVSLETYRRLRYPNADWLINPSTDRTLELEQEITDLKKKTRDSVVKLSQAELSIAEKEAALDLVKKNNLELIDKQKIYHIHSRVCEPAKEKILKDEVFKKNFENGTSCETVVVSIDIRRSTELMLKARSPKLFSEFITELSRKLSEIILENFGIFDKFTGDGILSFFPKFYSGEQAIIRALKAAQECHKAFEEHYRASKKCFNVFIKDVGLGIGIDYGTVTLVNTRNELTVVGIPVVYACRMGGAKAGDTLLNQPAMEEISRVSDNLIKATETEIEIKNEGTAIAYIVELPERTFEIEKPGWLVDGNDEKPAVESSDTESVSNEQADTSSFELVA